jgi:hypothetical protein
MPRGCKPGERRGGRKPGTRNKVSAETRQIVLDVFANLGATKAMTEWARANPTDFYKIWAKLIPDEPPAQRGGDLNILINVDDAKRALAERLSRRLVGERVVGTIQ